MTVGVRLELYVFIDDRIRTLVPFTLIGSDDAACKICRTLILIAHARQR